MRGLRRIPRILTILTAVLLAGLVPALAQDAEAGGSGQIEGKVSREGGKGVGGVTVVVTELGLAEITDNDGSFRFVNVPAGTYNLTFSLGENADSAPVTVKTGMAASMDRVVDWDVSFAETITVYSASRRRERIVDAPASVTLVSEEEIQDSAATGQLAKVLEFAPGVEVTQSGIHDFNLNTRGFNSSLNRRVQVLIDGRNPAVPFLASTEWSYLSNMGEMASVELVRGPSSALYGANAFNGVLNLVTKAPRNAQGGRLSLTGGDLSTLRGEINWATNLSDLWFLRLSGEYSEGESFYQQRVTQLEYPGLPQEVAFGTDEYDSTRYAFRLDRYLRDEQDLLTIEGGIFETDTNGVTVTGIGRVQVLETDRDYLRLNYSTPRFNFLAYQNNRESPDQIALASGGRIFLDSEIRRVEAQYNDEFGGGKTRLVVGVSYEETEIDTANFQGIQTLVFAPVDSDASAVFAQADFDLSDSVKLVLAGRYDESSLHDDQVSPKAALVWGFKPNHTLRFSYNEAFQVANYSEFFLDAPTALPTPAGPLTSLDLRPVEFGVCLPLLGVSCGFDTPVGVRALGNSDLELEEVSGFEVGYSGIFANKAFLTIDYYNNELDNFITDLQPNPFGSVNPAFGPYTLPNGAPAPAVLLGILQGALGPAYPFLSNNVDGTPILALASYTNAGQVDTQGVDLGLNYYATPQWVLDFSYSWFDFEVKEFGNARPQDLFPNAPENKFSAGVTYNGPKWGFSLKYRWTEEFFWSAGSFVGPVPEYELVDFSASYQVNDNIELSVNVSNLFDEEHYQSFGGDVLGQRALGTVVFNW